MENSIEKHILENHSYQEQHNLDVQREHIVEYAWFSLK